ncbi:MAG: hypothetical protein EBY20_01675 [Alphaproteobacteria bacterium]|jgi:hypothetical protein|uniref:Uncharacterized protein n=1 Tax=viral metagenome TaxID=1070528 RepID=A0A6C0HSB9_9ZZZZ|nr:hypothetical protein [Alphaproteobacteria bacterium]
MNKKQVRFNTKKYIYIIPYLTEYITQNELWWSQNEKEEAKKSAFEEINRLRSIHTTINLRDALRLLYQPNNITYNKNNFEECFQ